MIGEHYFPLRQETGLLEEEALALAHAAGCAPGVTEPLPRLREEDEPLLLLILGSHPRGHAEVVSSLIGLTETLAEPHKTISRVRLYAYGETTRLFEKEPLVEGLEINAPFLKDFEVLDTPGAAVHSAALRNMVLRCVPAADFLLFLIADSDPWNEALWKLLQEIPLTFRARVLILLQKPNLRTSAKALQMKKEILEHCRQKFDFQPPCFVIDTPIPSRQPRRMRKEKRLPPWAEHVYHHCHPGSQREELLRARMEMAMAVLESTLEKLPPPSAAAMRPNTASPKAKIALDETRQTVCDQMVQEVQQAIRESETTGLSQLKKASRLPGGLFLDQEKGVRMWGEFSERVMACVTSSAHELVRKLGQEKGISRSEAATSMETCPELLQDLVQTPRRFLNSMTWQNRFFWALSARQRKLRWLAAWVAVGVVLTTLGLACAWPWAWWSGLGAATLGAVYSRWKGNHRKNLYQLWQKSVTRAFVGVGDSLTLVLRHEMAHAIHPSEPQAKRKKAGPMPQSSRLQAENLQNRIGKLRERLEESME